MTKWVNKWEEETNLLHTRIRTHYVDIPLKRYCITPIASVWAAHNDFLQSVQYGKGSKKSTFIEDKSGNTTSAGWSRSTSHVGRMYIPLIWPHVSGTWPLWSSSPQTCNSNMIVRKTSDKFQSTSILQTPWPALLPTSSSANGSLRPNPAYHLFL